MGHFRDAEKLTDRDRNPEDWAEVQFAIANLLINQGQYGNAESILRTVVDIRTHLLGPEHPNTLGSRNNLALALREQGKYTEAEAQDRELIKIAEETWGPSIPTRLRAATTWPMRLASKASMPRQKRSSVS